MYTERTSNTAPHYDLCLDGPYCADPEAVQPDEENVCIDPATTVESKRTGHDLLDSAIVGFTSASLSFGSSLKDEKKILEFLEGAKRVVDELLLDVELGKLTFEQATEELHRLRGTLELQTEAATDLRRAWAKLRGSAAGETFYAAEKRVARALFGEAADVSKLSADQLRKVHLELALEVSEHGAATARFGKALTRAGRAFSFVSFGVTVYGVATSEAPKREAAKAAVLFAVGTAGRAVGGAAGAAICGPVCVPIGAFLGDLVATGAADYLFDQWVKRD